MPVKILLRILYYFAYFHLILENRKKQKCLNTGLLKLSALRHFPIIEILGLEPKHPGTRILCLTNLAISQLITRTRIELITPP